MENEKLLLEGSGQTLNMNLKSSRKETSDASSWSEMAGCSGITSVIAQSVCEIPTPITVGIFGKWGSGKSRIMKTIVDEMAVLTKSLPKCEIGLLQLLWRLVFFFPLLNYKCKQTEIKYIFVSMTALDYVGTDKLWAGIITKISKQLDKSFGRNKVKFFRAFHSRVYSLDSYNNEYIDKNGTEKWKANPLTAFIFPILSLILIGATIAIIVIFGFPVISGADTSIGSIFSSVFVGVIGVGTISQIGNVAKVAINLIRTQSAKVTKLAKRPDFTSSLGFMSTVKKEIRYMTGLTTYIGHLIDTDIRICLTIDDVDRLNKKLIMDLFQVVTLLDSTPNSPFVQFLSMDPLVVANIVKKALSYELASNISGHEYIKRLIRLPFNMPTLSRSAKKSTLKEVIRQQLNHNYKNENRSNGFAANTSDHKKTANIRSSSKVACYGELETVKSDIVPPARKDGTTVGNITMQFLKNSDECIQFIDDNLITIKRIVQSIEVSIRLYIRRNNGKIDQEQANDLSAWIILVDQWPYRLSWLWQYVEDNRQKHSIDSSYPRLPESAKLEDIYRIIACDLSKAADWENLITLDGDPELFKRFLQVYQFRVKHLENFLPYTTNLNYSLKRIAARTMAKTNAIENSAKLAKLRRDVTEQKALISWTVEDFCTELSEMGLEEINIAKYQQAARENNINGNVLVNVSLDDLKKAFQMTIGDWTLFTSHVKAYRSFYGGTESELPLINTTGSPATALSAIEMDNSNSNNNNSYTITEVQYTSNDNELIADTVV